MFHSRMPATTSNDEFVYAISHDLRGPLLNLQGFLRRVSGACDLLESCAQAWNLTPEQGELCNQLLVHKIIPSLEVLDRNTRRMDRLLTALLDLSRAGREPPRPQRVSASELVRAVVEEFRAAAMEKKASLVVDPLPDLWADPGRLEQIFRHLLGNALKFLSPDREGRITVGGCSQDGDAICWVEDNGVGLRPQDQTRIFLPFGRVQEVEAPGEGTGLATVRKLIEQQGGRVWVESTHRHGSRFSLGFPAAPQNKT